MKIKTYRRMGKRTHEVVEADSTDIVSNLSGFDANRDEGSAATTAQVQNAGFCGDEIVNHCLHEPIVAARPFARKKGKSIQETEGISSDELSLHCFLVAFPRRQRSVRRAVHKNLATVQNSDQIMEHHPSQPNVVACKLARRKRKKKQEAEETSDSELISPRSFRCRGQSKRRLNHDNIITQQQGKLDTNMFECYLENLWRSFSEENRKSITHLDSLWFSLYTKEPSKGKVMNWIKRKHIFSKKYVFVPIVQWCHWSLLIFCHFGESVQFKTRTPCMLLLDSLQMANPKRLEPGIRKFVLDIYKAEGRPENKELIYKIPLLVPKVPQQRNDEECGNYVLYYLKLFVESAPENFSTCEGYPYFMKEDWFTPEGLECFSKKLDSICK